MISRIRAVFRRRGKSASGKGLSFNRPLILFQSDDWARVGVRDRAGWDELEATGLTMGENPYDSYSLETPNDLQALSDVLRRHRDSVGRHPCIGMNFIMANVDFPRGLEGFNEKGPREIPLLHLTEGLPQPWARPGLTEAYLQGGREGLFYPALHGLSHFCMQAVLRECECNKERRDLLHTLWRSGTPYIHWRMPWVGYEYWDPFLPRDQRFLPLAGQRAAIHRAAEIYRAVFASVPLSACAPGYRANQDTKTAWFEAGVRVVQGGRGDHEAPQLDTKGMLLTFRNVEMETATEGCKLEAVVACANECLANGVPAVVSMHSINFHSTIRNFLAPALQMLDSFLAAMEERWSNLLYVNDGDLWEIATRGFLSGEAGKIDVPAG